MLDPVERLRAVAARASGDAAEGWVRGAGGAAAQERPQDPVEAGPGARAPRSGSLPGEGGRAPEDGSPQPAGAGSRRPSAVARPGGTRHGRRALALVPTLDGAAADEVGGGAAATDRVALSWRRTRPPASAVEAERAAPGRSEELADVEPELVDHLRRRRPRTRWAVRGSVVIAAAVLLAVVAAGAALALWRPWVDGAAQVSPSMLPTPAAVPAAAPGESPSPRPVVLVVHVAGAVGAPGLVTLAPGSRVADALTAAGGAAPGADLDRLNLAAPVADGEQIYVPRLGEPDGGAASQAEAGGGPGVVDLNTADAATLQSLPGIGPALAGRIVDWRTRHGPFTDVAALDAVPGIGPAVLARLDGLVRT